ncbi:MAG: biotin--[acetyl-CoA-carboxylase] ligase [Thiobacillus sp.]|nr:biotin--[acetyl-CoA-carboxylase] ligase [Thiobacillus sp.]
MNTRLHKDLFPILRRLSDGAFHSGQALAHEFGLSRASVFNVLTQAEGLGMRIHAVRGRGYRLPDPVDWLDACEIVRHLGEAATAYEVHVLDSVDSTNRLLMTEAQACLADGHVVVAEHQQAGRGRRGRSWHATPGGGLMFSVLWRFEGGLQAMAGLSLAVGLAVARAVNRHSTHAARLKWPNDILVGHRKLAGILIEIQGDMHGMAYAVAGVGLNIRIRGAQRDRIDQAVIDLDEIGVRVGRNRLLADCLVEMHRVMKVFRCDGFAALRAEWEALDAYAGKLVRLQFPDGDAVSGLVEGVDETGALRLRDAQGRVHLHNGGEISLRPEIRS